MLTTLVGDFFDHGPVTVAAAGGAVHGGGVHGDGREGFLGVGDVVYGDDHRRQGQCHGGNADEGSGQFHISIYYKRDMVAGWMFKDFGGWREGASSIDGQMFIENRTEMTWLQERAGCWVVAFSHTLALSRWERE